MFLVASEELKLQPLSLSYKQTFHNGKDTTLQEYSFEERGLFPSPLEFGSLFETYETCSLSIYYLFDDAFQGYFLTYLVLFIAMVFLVILTLLFERRLRVWSIVC